MSKYELMDEIFDIKNNHNLEELKTVEAKVTKYIEENGDDPQVSDALITLKVYIKENSNILKGNHDYKGFKDCCELAAPILARLSSTDIDNWDYYDLRILCRVIDLASTYKKSCEIAERALKKLEDFSQKERYLNIKLVFHINIMLRLTRTKYLEMNAVNSAREHRNIQKIFVEHYQQALRICSRGEFPMYLAMAKLRWGIFINMESISQEGLDIFKEMGDHEGYEYWKNEVEEFKKFRKIAVNTGTFDIMVGNNIRKARNNYGISMLKASQAIGYSSDMVGAMERGEKEIKISDIFKLAHLYGVSVDDFFHDIEVPEVEAAYIFDFKRTQIQKMINMVKGFSEEEMGVVMDMVKVIQNMTRQNKGEII